MARHGDNTAKKLTSTVELSDAEMAEIDAGWELAEQGEEVEAMTEMVHSRVRKTLEKRIQIEDVFGPGKEALKKLLSPVPKGLTLLSGDNKLERVALDGFGNKKIYVTTYPGMKRMHGDYPQNRDGVSVLISREGDLKTVSLVVLHSDAEPESDAAPLVNAAAIAAANHQAHDQKKGKIASDSVFRSVDLAVEEASREIPFEGSIDGIHAVIKKDPQEPFYRIDVAKIGPMHCLTLDPDGHFESLSVDPQLRPYKDKLEMGLTLQELQETFDEKMQRDQWILAPEEIVVLASDDIVQRVGGEKKLAFKISQFLREGRSLEEIESILIEAVKMAQEEASMKDRSASLVLFQVPKK